MTISKRDYRALLNAIAVLKKHKDYIQTKYSWQYVDEAIDAIEDFRAMFETKDKEGEI